MRILRKIKGFTLVEVVIIIVILTVLGFAVYMKSSDFYTIKLNSAARKLASDMRFAQQMSISTQTLHGVVFNYALVAAPNKYTVYEANTPGNPARDPAGGRDFIVDYTTGEFMGITISTNPSYTTLPIDPSSGPLVKFNSKGEPLDKDNNALTTSTNTVRLSYQATDKDIKIEPTTGRVSY